MIAECFTDETNGKLQEIQEFAKTHLYGGSFDRCLSRLVEIQENNKDHYGDEIILYSDWASYSLGFSFSKGGVGFSPLIGGIIYHGPVDGKYPETYSVTTNPSDGWQIHT